MDVSPRQNLTTQALVVDTWSHGVTVSTLDSESSDRGSNPRETLHDAAADLPSAHLAETSSLRYLPAGPWQMHQMRSDGSAASGPSRGRAPRRRRMHQRGTGGFWPHIPVGLVM